MYVLIPFVWDRKTFDADTRPAPKSSLGNQASNRFCHAISSPSPLSLFRWPPPRFPLSQDFHPSLVCPEFVGHGPICCNVRSCSLIRVEASSLGIVDSRLVCYRLDAIGLDIIDSGTVRSEPLGAFVTLDPKVPFFKCLSCPVDALSSRSEMSQDFIALLWEDSPYHPGDH